MQKIWIQSLWVALGGAIGAVGRFGVSLLLQKFGANTWPWATLIVNVLGSFCFAGIVVMLLKGLDWSDNLKLFVLTGILGAFTTFSSFTFETWSLWQQGQVWLSVVNIACNLVFCFLAFILAVYWVGLGA